MKITFITTGGTIDKAYSKKKGTYNFDILDPSVKNILKNTAPNFEYDIISLLKKDSMDITDEDKQLIFDTCKKVDNDKIIITHGTDTILDTAKKIAGINKTVVLVGASQPERFKETDADFNIGMAVGSINILPNGVYVAMNGRIYEHNKCKKHDSGHFMEK
jgi:L-asparaginase